MRYFILLISLMFMFSMPAMLSCGSSGGDDDDDNDDDNDSADPESCAPSTLAAPTVDLNTEELGPWTLTLTETTSTCDYPPDSITCILEMEVTGNDVAISGTCTSEADIDVTVTVTGISGIVSGDTLYWGATLRGTVDDYTETDTVPCTGVAFVSDILSETFNVTVSVSWENDDDSGSCTTSFSGIFQ